MRRLLFRKVALSLVRVDEEARERSVISLENLRKFVGAADPKTSPRCQLLPFLVWGRVPLLK